MVSRPSVVTVSSFGRQKLIKDMTRISVYSFKQVIVGFRQRQQAADMVRDISMSSRGC